MPINGRYKAFLFVGIAYFLTAVLAPLAVLLLNGTDWKFPPKGWQMSLWAGISRRGGRVLCPPRDGRGTGERRQERQADPRHVGGSPNGAPIINAVVNTILHPCCTAGWGAIKWQFVSASSSRRRAAILSRCSPESLARTKPAARSTECRRGRAARTRAEDRLERRP
ncbi:MAG: hypothetical protein R3F11_12485 [Verrucomicrobiales bacterium]